MLFLGGMIGWNGQQEFESDDFIEQVAQALRNIVDVLAEAGAGPRAPGAADVVRRPIATSTWRA